MKKKKRKWLKILLIVIGIVSILGITINIIVNKVLGNVDNINEADIASNFDEYEVVQENLTVNIKGTGEITSFNIEQILVPTYGVIKEKYVNDGEKVNSKQKLFRILADGYYQNINSSISGIYFELENNGQKEYLIYNLDEIGIEMYVLEKDAALLATGQKAIVKITALNKEVEGTVKYISKLPIDGRFKVKVSIPYTDDIRFGYGASVKIIVEEKQNVITIPYEALEINANNEYYVIKKENKSTLYDNFMYGTEIPEEKKTYVEIGTITNGKVEIVSGLQNGDIVLGSDWY